MTVNSTMEPDIEHFGAELKTDAVIIQPEEARIIAKQYYGLDGKVDWLWGEKDSNYQLTLPDGNTYLLKILNPGESQTVTSFHSQALMHVESRDPTLPVQRIIPTLDGQADFRIIDSAGQRRSVRVVSFVPGTAQNDTPTSAKQRYNAGRMLARLQLALEDFTYDGVLSPIIWDMQHSLMMREFLPLVEDETVRQRLQVAINVFENEVIPVLDTLPIQVIHNDFNTDNILVNANEPDGVTGIIDFGDMVRAPALFDLAVAVSYQMGTDSNLIDEACDCLAGYASLKSLTEQELDLLYPAIVMRYVMRYTIAAWRSNIFPEKKAHLRRYWPTLLKQLDLLEDIGRDAITARFKQACQEESTTW